MKYIIMAGGNYTKFETPKQLLKVCGEVIIERTIRLLRKNGITDIAISTNNPAFDYIDVEKLRDKENQFEYWGKEETKKSNKSWLRAYYPINEPVCYLHGDVYFSDEAIKTIVDTRVKDTMFFCTYDKQDGPKDPRSSGGREPLAYKVGNYKLFRNAVDDLLRMIDNGKFKRFPPCSWNVYRYLNGLDIGLNATGYGDLNSIFHTKGDYVVINDYTNDVDDIKDVKKIEKALKYVEGENMGDYKVKALIGFNDYCGQEVTDGNNYVVRKKGDVFNCTEERYNYLKEHNAVELVEVETKEEPTVVETVETSTGTFGYGEVEVTETEPTEETEEDTIVEEVEEVQEKKHKKKKKK